MSMLALCCAIGVGISGALGTSETGIEPICSLTPARNSCVGGSETIF